MSRTPTPAKGRAVALHLYLWASALLAPLGALLLHWRLWQGKEDPKRIKERRGRASRPRPEGRLIWCHAASVGESLSLLPLIERLLSETPDLHILVTTTTRTSAKMMADRLPARAIHQFVPLDLPGPISRFLRHWRPDLGIWVESELWPRMILRAKAQMPLLLLNARLSERSAQSWQKAPDTARALLANFDHALAQDDLTAERLERIGLPHYKITVAGSTKESAGPTPVSTTLLAQLREMTGTRPLWLAASIHAGEEEAIALAAAKIHAQEPDTLLILAPRHPDRAALMREAMARHGLNSALRSQDEPIRHDTHAYIADTLGEMGLWYSLAPICFVGGSFVPVGGHNPFEPLLFGAHVLHGPLVANFAPYYAQFDAEGSSQMVADASELAQAVTALFTVPRPIAILPPQAPLEAALHEILPRLPATA